jgi:hypothetical protein
VILLRWLHAIFSKLRRRLFEQRAASSRVLPSDFPQVRFTASDGQYWRVHPAGLGAWYFASIESHANPHEVGRFDLPAPMGTCYVGAYDDAVTMEAVVLKGLSPQEQREAVADRNVSAMALDEFYDKPIADFTSPDLEQYGAPRAVELLGRPDARPWALAAHKAGFVGIRYRLRKDPQHRTALALFGPNGPGPKPQTQGEPQPFVVGQIHLAGELANREFTGDPLAE